MSRAYFGKDKMFGITFMGYTLNWFGQQGIKLEICWVYMIMRLTNQPDTLVGNWNQLTFSSGGDKIKYDLRKGYFGSSLENELERKALEQGYNLELVI